MKFKKTIFLGIVFILVFIIYIFTLDKKIYYISTGDFISKGITPYKQNGYSYSDYIENYLRENNLLEFYSKDFTNADYRITDLINDINNNIKVNIDNKDISIKNALIKADVLTVSIGSNDLYYKLGMSDMNYNLNKIDDIDMYIDQVIKDLDKLMQLLREYCKEDIFLIGVYNPLSSINKEYKDKLDEYFKYINSEYGKIAKKYNVHFIDIYEEFKNNSDYFPNPTDFHINTKGQEAISKKIIDIIEKDIIN